MDPGRAAGARRLRRGRARRGVTVDLAERGVVGGRATLCGVHIPPERRHFDRVAAPARRSRRSAAPSSAFGRRTAAESKPGTIIVCEGGYATIEIHHERDGHSMSLYAVEEDGRWGMARRKKTGL